MKGFVCYAAIFGHEIFSNSIQNGNQGTGKKFAELIISAPSLIGKFHDMLCYLNTNSLVGSTKLLTFSEHAY